MLAKAFEAICIELPRELQIAGKAGLKRAVLSVSGNDAGKFLNGLTTNRILDRPDDATQSLPVSSGQYTAFLSPQGRLLYDAFLFRKEKNEYLVDCDERIGTDLLFHLQSHKLRAKIKLEDMSNEYKVETWWNLPSLLNGPKMTITDPRGSLGLLRSLCPRAETEIATEDVNAKLYDLLRYAAGIAEGPLEMRRIQSIPLECNLDWLGAVVFDKGCYVGQELMARTHFRGTIRKRIMPFKILGDKDSPMPFKVKVEGGVEGIPSGAELFSVEPPNAKSMTEVHRMEMDAQPVGKVIGTLGNLGMALVRLPSWTEGHRFAVHRPSPSAGADQRQFVLVEPYKPHWWPALNPAELL